MMEFLFLLGWTSIFLLAGVLVWKRNTAHIKLYLMLVLHFIFLAGIFYLYPMILEMTVKS